MEFIKIFIYCLLLHLLIYLGMEKALLLTLLFEKICIVDWLFLFVRSEIKVLIALCLLEDISNLSIKNIWFMKIFILYTALTNNDTFQKMKHTWGLINDNHRRIWLGEFRFLNSAFPKWKHCTRLSDLIKNIKQVTNWTKIIFSVYYSSLTVLKLCINEMHDSFILVPNIDTCKNTKNSQYLKFRIYNKLKFERPCWIPRITW